MNSAESLVIPFPVKREAVDPISRCALKIEKAYALADEFEFEQALKLLQPLRSRPLAKSIEIARTTIEEMRLIAG